MKDCFELRFNLHRCGVKFADNTKIFAEMFSYEEIYIKDSLKEYGEFLENTAQDIKNTYQEEVILNLFDGKKILFLGDSMTSDRIGYYNMIKTSVSADCFDGAVSGAKSVDILSQIGVSMETFGPGVVSIMIGTNDVQCVDEKQNVPTVSLQEYEKNLDYMIKFVLAEGAVPIITTIPPIHEKRYKELFGVKKTMSNSLILKYNDIIKLLVEKYGVYLNDMTDVYNKYEQDKLFEQDGVHLSAFGQKVLAERLLFRLIQILRAV